MNFTGLLNYPSELLLSFTGVAVFLPISALVGIIVSWKLSIQFSNSKLKSKVYGKHCLVTGASQGLGKQVAIELVKAGAHVTIIARGKKDPITRSSTLEGVVKDLAKFKLFPDQIVDYLAVDLTKYEMVLKMAKTLIIKGHQPEWVICSAGSATPGFMADQLPKKALDGSFAMGDHEWMMHSNYFTAVNVVSAIMQSAKDKSDPKDQSMKISGFSESAATYLPKKIVFVGSVMSTLSMIGCSGYTGSKFAIRGFAEGLRQELLPLNIDVSMFLPGNINTEGFATENLTKPAITAQIEGASVPESPESTAKALLAGILSKRFYITNDLLGELARTSVNGGCPRPNLLMESVAAPLLTIIFTVWSYVSDNDVRAHFKKQ
ncbi:3-dehydrosphinganine reductase [Globomyces sp. JEL0801]|nr:3-dehydrosphinganine reductase [Globomyces sp. JEL0801]